MGLKAFLDSEKCPCCGRSDNYFTSRNLTHNLAEMARKAGVYDAVWHPEQLVTSGTPKAWHVLGRLTRGTTGMKADPAQFKKLEPSNGWGTYDDFLLWLEEYRNACELFPDALVTVER
jgi:hypothetical protein